MAVSLLLILRGIGGDHDQSSMSSMRATTTTTATTVMHCDPPAPPRVVATMVCSTYS
jgi:hypothetical protein